MSILPVCTIIQGFVMKDELYLSLLYTNEQLDYRKIGDRKPSEGQMSISHINNKEKN